ncbi:MAG: hypothetical protein AAB676_07445 [Verrucomicrobiota bacterium]
MQTIRDAVATEYGEEKRLPLDNFSTFLIDNMRDAKGQDQRDRSKDLWGTPWRKFPFVLLSCGPCISWLLLTCRGCC